MKNLECVKKFNYENYSFIEVFRDSIIFFFGEKFSLYFFLEWNAGVGMIYME
jgi:hypothetical protein